MTDQKNQNKSESIFFVTLPKSGTVYTWDNLEILTGLSKPNLSENKQEWKSYVDGMEYGHSTIYASGDFSTQRLLPGNMKRYLPSGYLFGGHMAPSFHNIETLVQSGIKKIVVSLRDPRDATVSWSHHVTKRGTDYTNYQSKIYPLTLGFFDESVTFQMSHHVRNFLPMAVTWIESWLNFHAQADRRLDLQFMYFDQMKSDPVRYFSDILKFFDRDLDDPSRIKLPKEGQRHYREGTNGAWEREFSADDKQFSDLLINDRLLRSYNLAAETQLSRNILAAGAANSPNVKLKAATAALELFPNSIEAARVAADAIAPRGGTDAVAGALNKLAKTNHTTATIFQIPDNFAELLRDAKAHCD